MIINCNIPLMRVVEFDLWILDSAVRDGRPTYLPRKWLNESYGILDGVRHLGPRRRAELDAMTHITKDERREFVESWEKALGHELKTKAGLA